MSVVSRAVGGGAQHNMRVYRLKKSKPNKHGKLLSDSSDFMCVCVRVSASICLCHCHSLH